MTEEEMAEEYTAENGFGSDCNNLTSNDVNKEIEQAYLAGLKEGRPKWHKYSERPVKKINALCFDIKQNKFILGFYDLEADEWLRYGGYETIHIDLWKEIVLPKLAET